jgi:hypothetical protein
MTNGQSSANLIKPVKILSETDAPPMTPVTINLHYVEDGRSRHIFVPTMRPVFFNKLVVSTVLETLPARIVPTVPYNSPRNIARNAVFTARNLRASAAKPVTFPTPVLDMRAIEPHNITHLLAEIIPYYLLAKAAVGGDITLLLSRQVKGSFAELLSTLGIVPVTESRRVTGEIIKIRGTRGLSVYDLPETFDCSGIQFAPDIYDGHNLSSASHPERIFFARRDSRNIENQAEVEALARQYGYTIIFPEDHSITEQLAIGASAKHVLAIHGAAISLLLMNKKAESLIELFPPNVQHQLYPAILGEKIVRYEQIVPDFNPSVVHSGWETILSFKGRKFSVDTPLLGKVLSDIHGTAQNL